MSDDVFFDTLDTAALALSNINGLSGESKAVREAIRRLKEGPSPPPPGSVRIRVAISLDDGGIPCFAYIGPKFCRTDGAAVRLVNRAATTHLAIATIDVPPLAVPEVAASVEAFDPEATA